MKLVVVGQGYVGLPVAMRAVEVGHSVVGVDLDADRVAALNAGTSYVEDISASQLQAALDSGRYVATTDYAHAAAFDAAIITVPTPLRESLPDLSFIEASAQSLGEQLKRGATVVLESTTYPGTTQELLVPILEAASGLTAGVDFALGYSPERIDPGNPNWGLVNTPKVVSGIDPESLAAVRALYDTLVEQTVPVSTPREAELTKLLENTFRHVNIALVNELAVYAHQLGVNVWEAIDAASTKPFGFMRFTPGPGVGGHCLPVDPSYLSWQVRRSLGQSFRFVELANDVNEHQPDYVVQRAIELLNERKKSLNGSRVLLLGIAYKKNSSDSRESPALRIVELLNRYGANVGAVDAHVPSRHWPEDVERFEYSQDVVQAHDLVVVVTDHDGIDYELLTGSTTLVLDTKNRVTPSANVFLL
ncbi:nucleotide sugar dehydrogenase [Microbacterium sp. NPDC089318]